MKMLCFISIVLWCLQSIAQPMVEKQIEVGMLVKIPKCKAQTKAFESMDVYRKTRFPKKIVIDTATGEGIFETFFTAGDFDAKRLPCDYANQQYKVAALRVFEDEKTKEEKRVMILYTTDPYTVIWVEFDKALELKEIEF